MAETSVERERARERLRGLGHQRDEVEAARQYAKERKE